MLEGDFYEIYPAAAELYRDSELNIDAVRAVFGHRGDWDQLRRLLQGSDAVPPHGVPGEAEQWYAVADGHEYWPAYLRLLVEQKKWTPRAVQSIDIASSRVVNYLFEPAATGNHHRHGLVIGHVQSGKTANFTAVLSKAADAGYNFFIVLAGLYNDLRDQTQLRLSKELAGTVTDPEKMHVPGSEYRVAWREETRRGMDFHDLEHPAHPDPSQPTLAVIKKNVSPLEAINAWIQSFPPSVLRDLSVLIVDDEADHASVNTMTGEERGEYSADGERSPSRINALLRTLIKSLPRVAYVGYTATPFANVFIDPAEGDEELGRTLYPKDFIVCLPKPLGHFGLEDVFPPEPDTTAVHLVIVPQDEADTLRDMTETDRPTLDLPTAMREALMNYLLAGAIRRCRGDSTKHHTMMVHTKHTIRAMTPLVRRIRATIQHYKVNLPLGDSVLGNELAQAFRDQWETEFRDAGCEEPWEEVSEQLLLSLVQATPHVYEINMDSDDALHFDGRAVRAIAIGGNRLSRGLTLEGLCVSLFVRPTTTHDTLMQMSRWFGFRTNFSDLVRVHVTHEIAERFTGMVEIERELRDDLERYEVQSELTPLDFGVRVLKQTGMDPTRAGARRGIETIRAGNIEDQKMFFTGRFHFDDARLLRRNLSALAEMIGGLQPPQRLGPGDKTLLWTDVPFASVVNLLEDLSFPAQSTWPLERIVGHIDSRVGVTSDELRRWSFGIIGLEQGVRQAPLARYGLPELSWVLPFRTRLAQSNSIGTLPGSWDFIVDLPEYPRDAFRRPGSTSFSFNRMWSRRSPAQPLLLAYVIDKKSEYGRLGGRAVTLPRTDLFREGEEREHVLGLALVFPRADVSEQERDLQREYYIRRDASPFPGL